MRWAVSGYRTFLASVATTMYDKKIKNKIRSRTLKIIAAGNNKSGRGTLIGVDNKRWKRKR